MPCPGEVWDNRSLPPAGRGGSGALEPATEAVTYYEQALHILPQLPERRDTHEQ